MLGNSLLILAGLFVIAGAAASSMRNIRVMMFGAGFFALLYFAFVDWNLAGVGLAASLVFVSGFRLATLLQRVRSGSILDHERELFAEIMQVEDPVNQRRLRDVLQWQDISSGEVLMQQGDRVPPLIYIAHGTARITHDDAVVGNCGPGDFLGEMSIVSGEQASATVIAGEPMRIANFDREALAEMVRHVPELGKAIDGALNRSLAAKVLRMNQSSGDSSSIE